jgi:polysaccharide biosynthesis/export protein
MNKIVWVVFLSFLISSCGINSNLMFKSKDYEVIKEDIPIAPTETYRIAPDDKFVFTLFANDGKRIVDMMSGISEDGTVGRAAAGTQIPYWVQPTGIADLPIIGLVKLAGLTIPEAQDTLALRFSKYYNQPYVQVEITNQRVIVFPGNGGDAKVVPLVNNNTTLMEALAMAGGITERGRANRVKVMRLTEDGRKVYEINLSKIEGLKYADMVVQAHDYIYVEPTRQLSRELVKELLPIISIITSAIVFTTIITNL